jgi:hypothetical protein
MLRHRFSPDTPGPACLPGTHADDADSKRQRQRQQRREIEQQRAGRRQQGKPENQTQHETTA